MTTQLTTVLAWGDWGYFVRFLPPISFYLIYWAIAIVFALWGIWDEYNHRKWRQHRDFEEAHRD